MKALTIGIICLTLIAMVSSQAELFTPALIKERAIIVSTNNDWYDEIDAAYYSVYKKNKDVLTKAFLPYIQVYNDIMIAYGNLQGSLEEVNASGQVINLTPPGLVTFMTNFNFSFYNFNTYQVAEMLVPFNDPHGKRSPPAAALRDAIKDPLFNIVGTISYLKQGSESCAINMLIKFNSLYQPIVNNVLGAVNTTNAVLIQLGANITASVKQSVVTLKTLTSKLNNCNNIKSDAARLTCAQQLDSYYNGNNSANRILVTNAIFAPAADYPTTVLPIFLSSDAIFPTRTGFVPTPEFNAQIEALRTSCN